MSDDLTLRRRRLRRILRQLPERYRTPTGLTQRARLLLMALVRSLADGEAMPTQTQLAAELEISVSSVGRAFRELKDAGLVVAEGAGHWGVDVVRLEAWVEPEPPTDRPRSSAKTASSTHSPSVNLTDPFGQSDRSQGEPASFVVVAPAAGVGSDPTPASAEHASAAGKPAAAGAAAGHSQPEPADLAPLSAEDRALQRMVAACHRNGMRTPPRIQAELLAWYRKGTPVDEVERACDASSIYGAYNLAYARGVLRDRGVNGWAVLPDAAREPEENVIEFASHRKRGGG